MFFHSAFWFWAAIAGAAASPDDVVSPLIVEEFTVSISSGSLLRGADDGRRGLVFDAFPSCNQDCGTDQTICADSRDGSPNYAEIRSNQEGIPYGKVTFCQQGCSVVAEVVMADGCDITEYFMHVACEQGDYPTVGNGSKPKAGAMNQNDKCVLLGPTRVRCDVPLSAVAQDIRDCWEDHVAGVVGSPSKGTETIIKLTTVVPPAEWTPPDAIACVSSPPSCPCAAAATTNATTTAATVTTGTTTTAVCPPSGTPCAGNCAECCNGWEKQQGGSKYCL